MTPIILFYHIISCIGTALLLGGAAAVFRKARRSGEDARALRLLGFTLAAWGAVYLICCLNPQHVPLVHFRTLSVLTLSVGNLFVILCLFYPLELARPGWFGWRNVGRLILPYAAVTAFYFAMTALLGQTARELQSIPEMLSRLGEFNVWFRFVLYLTVCIYLVYLLVSSGVEALESRRGTHADRRRANRLLVYGIGMVSITAAYLAVLLYGTMMSMVVHRLVSILFFGIVIFNTLRPARQAEAEICTET